MRAAFLLLLLSAVSAAQSAPAKPDVFLVTIDTLRADHLHCYGDNDIQTPALDNLAKDGIRFAEAFTPSPITNTSHTSILTGLLPSSHGVTDFAMPLSDTHPTWAELLKAQGYHNAAFIGAVILDSKAMAPGLDRGFDFYDNFPEHPEGKSRYGRVERRGMEVVQHAEQWLNSNHDGPHFVWVHLFDPHDPYEPPPPYSDTYKDRLYDGEIAYADSAFANFIAYLKKQGWYDGALIIVTGDHGEGLGQHHENTHGIFLYDSTTHIPMIVKFPAEQQAGKTVQAQVRTIDILPTVLDVLGIAPPEKLDGASLKPYITGSEASDRAAIGETNYPLQFGWASLRSVRQPDFKFIEAPRPELYDLHKDPGETHNDYAAENPMAAKLREQLKNLPQVENVANLPDPKDHIEEQNLLHTAVLASEDEQPDQARAAFESVLKLDPKSPTALLQLGRMELDAKNYAKAADYLKRATEVRPADAGAAFDLGRAQYEAHNLTAARDALLNSLKLNPDQLPARILAARIFVELNDPDPAEDQIEAALLTDPDNVDAQITQARVSVMKKKFGDAQKQLETLAKSHPDNPEIYEVLAKAYAGLGKKAEAAAAEKKAQALRSQQSQ